MRTSRNVILIVGVVLGVILVHVNWQYEYPGWSTTANITGSIITFKRSQHMILTAKSADTSTDLMKSLGWMHAHDRYVQLCLYRLASQGLLTKHLPFNEGSWKQDIKSNQMNLDESSQKSLPHLQLHPEKFKQLQYYVDGINTYFVNHPRPIEFIMFNYFPEPFKATDVMTIYKYISYAGLNDVCLTLEKMFIEMLTETNVSKDILKSIFSPNLDGLSDELIDIYRSLKSVRPIADQDTTHVPKLINSNNWVISGNLSESGFPLMGSDPHMDISKIPNIFYESHYVGDDGHKIFGISLPGFAGHIMGRNTHLSFSLTFGMLDMADYFIENIVDKKYERDGSFYPLRERTVVLRGKTFYFYDTSEGHTLERNIDDSDKPLTDGRYLATRFGLSTEADVSTLDLQHIPLAKDVFTAKVAAWENGLGTNHLFADNKGNIAYQQGGSVPIRPSSSGLLPLPAWNSENLWQGYVKGSDYHSVVNPPEGYLATANNHIQAPGKPIVATFSALDNRINRIHQLLQSKEKFNVDDFKVFQSDTYSILASNVVPLVARYLGETDIERELLTWDFRTAVDSRPAAFYKVLYENLSRNILLTHFSKERVDKYLRYCAYPLSKMVQDLLLAPPAGGEVTPDVFKQTIRDTLNRYKGEVYGDLEHVFMTNVAFGGLLPAWTGVDVAPAPTDHCSECVKVGNQRTNQMGVPLYLSQAWRMVTDMGTDVLETVLPGGPGGNILSNFYAGEVQLFLENGYKKTEL